MDTPRRLHRVSLFAKFTAVILLLGIVPSCCWSPCCKAVC